jgi:carbon storage regulator CsrA
MLVLTRKKDEQLVIGRGEEAILVRILKVGQSRVLVGITAPGSVAIHREILVESDDLSSEIEGRDP